VLLLENKNKFDDNVFLLSGDEKFTYNEIFKAGDKIFTDKNKDLVLILCNKSVGTITAYVSAIRHNKVPLIIDENYKKDLIFSFIENYLPKYIVSQSVSFSELIDYDKCHEVSGCVIYKQKVSHNININENLSLLIPTSGSTGDPKCVRISSNNIDACTQSICEYLNIDVNSVSASHLPIHYAYGLSVLHNCILTRSKYVITNLTVLDKGFWDEFERYNITGFSCVPFTLNILRRVQLDFKKISSLKYVTQAGGYLSEKSSLYFLETFLEKNIKYFTMYGQTEASPRISYLAPEMAELKAGSAGVPISCGEATIYETGEPSGVGELCYKGENVALGYANNYIDLSLSDEFNGVLVTGDIVEIDTDGYIKIIGRKKRFIKISGISVNLDQVEKDANANFESVVVIGTDDKMKVLTISDDINEIKDYIFNKYNFNKVNFKVKKINEIPLNSSGKIDYKTLSEIHC